LPFLFTIMPTLDQLEKNLRFALANIDKQASVIVEQNKDFILDLNREKQLFDKGINSDGKLLRPYRPFTVSLKRQKGEPFNRTTLFDKGDFYKGFDLLFRNNKISIFSRDSKSSDLQEKYGSNIFGFTPDNSKIYAERFNSELTKYLKSTIYGRTN